MSELPSGTVTFLFTDVESSTELIARDETAYAKALADQRRILRAAVAGVDGEEISCNGEEFFFAFRRAKDAAVAALEGQRGLAGHDWPDGGRMRVRIGIHTGEPSVDDDGYLGLDVHRAARICSLGHGGQVLLSQRTSDLLAAFEPAGTSIRDLGSHPLKGLSDPEPIFQLVAEDLPAEFPSLRVATADAASNFDDHELELAEAAKVAVGPAQGLGARLRRRAPQTTGLAELGWRVRELLPAAPEQVRPAVGELGGELFSGGRTVVAIDRWLGDLDRKTLERQLAEYRDMAVLSKRAAREADVAAERLALIDRLERSRGTVAGRAATIEARVDELRAATGTGEASALAGLVEAARAPVRELTAELDQRFSEARAAVGTETVKLRRTRHRGVYRRGERYVVPHVDADGVERRREFETAKEARAYRTALRIERKREDDYEGGSHAPHDSAYDKPVGGGGPS